jgi:hypothetical protein
MGRWGWGLQDFLKYLKENEKLFFILQLFMKAPAPSPHRPTFIFLYIFVFILVYYTTDLAKRMQTQKRAHKNNSAEDSTEACVTKHQRVNHR